VHQEGCVTTTADRTGTIQGRRILVVEDEYFVANDMENALVAAGAEVVGPVPTIEAALGLIRGGERLDGAVLDINLRGRMSFDVANALQERGIPFVFATGYDRTMIPAHHAHVIRCEKPVDPVEIVGALFG
jgi:DNA-binding LytR/AlgR family response regulator